MGWAKRPLNLLTLALPHVACQLDSGAPSSAPSTAYIIPTQGKRFSSNSLGKAMSPLPELSDGLPECLCQREVVLKDSPNSSHTQVFTFATPVTVFLGLPLPVC